MTMTHYERIRDLSSYGTDKWLYAAIRAATKEAPGHTQMALNALRKRTPRDVLRMFPPTKEYDGERWGMKDYFYTIEKARAFGLDKPLGKHVEAFLWDYMEPHLNMFLVNCELRHIGKPSWRAMSVLDEYRAPPLLSVTSLCDKVNRPESFVPVYNLIFRQDEAMDGVYIGADFKLDYNAFQKCKSILARYISNDWIEAAEEAFKAMGEYRAISIERDYSLAVLSATATRRLKAHLKETNEPELIERVCHARRVAGVWRRMQRQFQWWKRDWALRLLVYKVRKALEQ